MNRLVDPQLIVFRAKLIAGFSELLSKSGIPQWELLQIASDVESMWRFDWPDGQEFGSTDMTYMVKQFIDSVITQFGYGRKLMTDFTPSLSVVEYSEMNHHQRVQKMESGL
jgi:hypothetical protein